MQFEEAFDLLVEHCAAISASQGRVRGGRAHASRTATHDNDIWIPALVRAQLAAQGKDQNALDGEFYAPFYDAAWEVCRTEVEAFASLTHLLRLAQFCSDHWGKLTT